MRVALLSTLEHEHRPGMVRPAFVSFAGARVVERQLDLALALGCERVACLVDGIGAEVLELQHRAERAGAKFVGLREASRLSGMVSAGDELLVMAPGVLPDRNTVERVLTKAAVLGFPADIAIPLGYERIDLEFGWSGVLLTHGGVVERLTELPPDTDAPSALMRIALQTGTRLVPIERRLIDDGEWHLNATAEALAAREKRWIAAQRETVPFTAPGIAVAERAGARLARDIVGRATEIVPLAIAGLSAIGALGLAIVGMPAIGLGFATSSALFMGIARVIERVASQGQIKPKRHPLLKLLDRVIDPIFILLLILAAPAQFGILRAFVPLVLFGLLQLGEKHGNEKWRLTYADRILLGSLLIPAAVFGFSTEAAALIALLVLASRFFAQFRAE